jgi:hypothetical protein
MQPQPSPPLPTFSPRLNRPYPARGHQNSYRTARKYAATGAFSLSVVASWIHTVFTSVQCVLEHRSTSPTTHVLRGPGQGINPYAALHDYIGREYAALGTCF